MKKIILLLLALAVCATAAAAFTGCNNEPSEEEKAYLEPALLEIAVMSDLHYYSPALIGDYKYSSYQHKMRDAKTTEISRAVIATALDAVYGSGVKYLLVAGDLCDNHALDSHEELSELFGALEVKGVSVFIVPGNHDISMEEGYYGYRFTESGAVRAPDFFSVDDPIAEFKRIYNNYGYSEALSVKGLSYTANLGNHFRLIAIDNCSSALTTETINWVKQELEKAKADGRKAIGMMHKPIDNIFGEFGKLAGLFTGGDFDGVTANADKLKKALIEGGMEIIFTGHNHCNNTATLSDDEGRELQDIMTVSLTQYGNGYRYVRFSENYTVCKINRITSVNPAYLPSYLTPEDREAVMKNFEEYSKQRLDKFIKAVINRALNGLGEKISAAAFGDNSKKDEIESFIDKTAKKFLNMPFYGTGSLDEYFKSRGGAFPTSSFKNVNDLAVYAMGKIVNGEKDFDNNFKDALAASVDGLLAMILEGGIYDVFSGIDGIFEGDIETAAQMLIKEGKLELLNSGVINLIMHFDKIASISMLSMFMPSDGIIDTPAEFTVIAELLSLLEAVVDMEILKYFEKDGDNYNGIFKLNDFIKNEVIEKLAPSLFSNKDLPYASFIIKK